MKWRALNAVDEINQLIADSYQHPVAIFKHSTRCGTSSLAKSRLEKSWDLQDEHLPIYLLDLIAHRDVSNELATKFQVRHESPQLLLIKDGKSIYDASHLYISVAEIKQLA